MEITDVKDFNDVYLKIEDEIKKSIIGQDQVVRNVLIGIIAGGNVLLEGAPGLGKTQLVKTIGKVLDLDFSRIQFTPDLMPVDIIGTEVINKTSEGISFGFEKGPIFSSIVLADEINRATPKTQSALLEAMQEKTVTVGNKTYKLPQPFFVLATQNPLEMEGTYPLPEAQLDRFMLKLNVEFPKQEYILSIIDLTTTHNDYSKNIRKIIDGNTILKMREESEKVLIAKDVKQLAINIVMASQRENTDIEIVKKYVKCGSSLRGIQSIIFTSKVKALIEGRYNVAFKDIQEMAIPCLRHRIFLNFSAISDNVSVDDVIKEIIKKVK
ncbi:AAA family ATPase [Haloimpatiens myeolchijeotgali]